jgi:anti-anti-sigma factor
MEDTITIRTELVSENCILINLAGRFDATSVNTMKEVFKDLIGGAVNQVVVDMSQVSFVDSAGLSALVSALKLVRRIGGDMVIAGMQPQAKTVFALTMLDQVIPIYADRQEALSALNQQVTLGVGGGRTSRAE